MRPRPHPRFFFEIFAGELLRTHCEMGMSRTCPHPEPLVWNADFSRQRRRSPFLLPAEAGVPVLGFKARNWIRRILTLSLVGTRSTRVPNFRLLRWERGGTRPYHIWKKGQRESGRQTDQIQPCSKIKSQRTFWF
jgi:hypothetical protein